MRHIVFALTLTLGAAGCATTGPNKGQFNLISMDQERAMGKQFDQQLRTEKKVIDDPQTVAYLQGLSDRLMKGAPDSPIKSFHVRVVVDPAVNAFAAPGGQLYVNSGLVKAAANESELAGVMGHEMGHGVQRHVTEQLSKIYGLELLTGFALGQNPGIAQQLVAQLGGQVVALKFSRDAEREADKLAVRYTSAARIDPNGLVTFFEKLQKQEGKSPPEYVGWLSTHPLTKDRIRDAELRVAKVDRRGMEVDSPAFHAFRDQLFGRVASR